MSDKTERIILYIVVILFSLLALVGIIYGVYTFTHSRPTVILLLAMCICTCIVICRQQRIIRLLQRKNSQDNKNDKL